VVVDLGGAHLVAALDDIDIRFLAALQLPQHAVDQAFGDERLQTFRCLHRRILPASPARSSRCLGLMPAAAALGEQPRVRRVTGTGGRVRRRTIR
jgi:hypothetical protein